MLPVSFIWECQKSANASERKAGEHVLRPLDASSHQKRRPKFKGSNNISANTPFECWTHQTEQLKGRQESEGGKSWQRSAETVVLSTWFFFVFHTARSIAPNK